MEYTIEELEDIEEEKKHKETLEALDAQAGKYKSLFGEFPAKEFSFSQVHDKICEEMKRRDLRPYKL